MTGEKISAEVVYKAMDIFKNLFRFNRNSDNTEQNGENLRRNYLGETEPECDMLQPRDGCDIDFPFCTESFMNPFGMNDFFEKMMSQTMRHFEEMVESMASPINIRFDSGLDLNHSSHEKITGFHSNDRLRSQYFSENDDPYQVESEMPTWNMQEEGVVNKYVPSDDISSFFWKDNNKTDAPDGPFHIRQSWSVVNVKIGSDGVAEITRVERSEDGNEKRTTIRRPL